VSTQHLQECVEGAVVRGGQLDEVQNADRDNDDKNDHQEGNDDHICRKPDNFVGKRGEVFKLY
jgi:hypothetical protein